MKKNLFSKKESKPAVPVQTASVRSRLAPSPIPLMGGEQRLFCALRDAVPIIDAALMKLIRLAGGFTVKASAPGVQKALDEFTANVPVSGGGASLNAFIERMFDCMLTCGSAVGEIVLDRSRTSVIGLYNASPDAVEIAFEENPFSPKIYTHAAGGTLTPVSVPALVLYCALPPMPGQQNGRSILSGLPFFASTLSTVFQSVGQNFERMGNLRYAVTYKPPQDFASSAYSDNLADTIAKEWANGMNTHGGSVKDFVAVGDVDIKVIGADGQMPEVQVPVRCILEQMIAKLGIPPFMLGLSWSTTERMSTQQADILTSELEAYRRYLTPVILRILRIWAGLNRFDCDFTVCWQDINLQDEVELARAELLRAQAKNLTKGAESH